MRGSCFDRFSRPAIARNGVSLNGGAGSAPCARHAGRQGRQYIPERPQVYERLSL